MESGVLLVDTVVGKMHEFAFVCGAVRPLQVLNGGKPSESFFIDVNAERVYTSYHHVDPHIKFVSVKQKRVGDVFRHNVVA